MMTSEAGGQSYPEEELGLEVFLRSAEAGVEVTEVMSSTPSTEVMERLTELLDEVLNMTEEAELEGSGSMALAKEEFMVELTTQPTTEPTERETEPVSTTSTTPLPRLHPEDEKRGPGFCTCMPCETELKRATLDLKVRPFCYITILLMLLSLKGFKKVTF